MLSKADNGSLHVAVLLPLLSHLFCVLAFPTVTNFRVTALSAGTAIEHNNASITLQWDTVDTAVNASNITSSAAPLSYFVQITPALGGVNNFTTTTAPYTVTGLSQGELYSVRIAFTSNVTSSFSTTLQVWSKCTNNGQRQRSLHLLLRSCMLSSIIVSCLRAA